MTLSKMKKELLSNSFTDVTYREICKYDINISINDFSKTFHDLDNFKFPNISGPFWKIPVFLSF